jgi:phosphate transport system protein
MEKPFEQQLEKLKTRVVKMCSLVDEQVALAMKAIMNSDSGLAQSIIDRDSEVDKYDVKIDRLCQRLIALNQPVAMDLRMILSSMTINKNIERIGDIAVNIAELSPILKEKPAFFEKLKIPEMFELATEMLKNSIDSFIESNAILAQKVIHLDPRLDQLNIENHHLILGFMKESSENVEPGVALIVLSRHLERIGDHAQNIAEDVYFMVEAQMIKHRYEKYFFDQAPEDI